MQAVPHCCWKGPDLTSRTARHSARHRHRPSQLTAPYQPAPDFNLAVFPCFFFFLHTSHKPMSLKVHQCLSSKFARGLQEVRSLQDGPECWCGGRS